MSSSKERIKMICKWYAGGFCSDSSIKDYDPEGKSPTQIAQELLLGKHTGGLYAFQLGYRTRLTVGGETVDGKFTLDPDITYYIGGKVLTQKNLEEGDQSILAQNMRGNNWDVVMTRCGQAIPISGEVVILDV